MATKNRIRAVMWGTTGITHARQASNGQLGEFIRALHPYFYTALFGSSFEDLCLALVDYWDLADAFDTVVLSASPADGRPAPMLYRQAAQALHALPGEVLYVDHRSELVDSARQAGLQTVYLDSPAQVGSDLLTLLQGQFNE